MSEDIQLNGPLGVDSPTPWNCTDPDNRVVHFDTEGEAATFQRAWRRLNGLDQMTGEALMKDRLEVLLATLRDSHPRAEIGAQLSSEAGAIYASSWFSRLPAVNQ